MASSEYYMKQDNLVGKITKVLQEFLTEKKQKWEAKHSSGDFFVFHPNTKWGADQKSKLDEKDINSFDVTLCSKFLLEFPWDEAEKLNENELSGIKCLKNVRNEKGHATTNSVTKEKFDENCRVCKAGLLLLNVPEGEKIVTEAENFVFLALSVTASSGSFTLDFKRADPKIVFTRVNGILFTSISDDELKALKFTLASIKPPILSKFELDNLKKVEKLISLIHKRSSRQIAVFLNTMCEFEHLPDVKEAILEAIEKNQ